MNFKNVFISAIRALRRNKMRSALTSVGVIIGVSSVIVMVGLGSSARTVVREKIISFGTNAMKIKTKNNMHWFSLRDMERLRQIVPQMKYITPLSNKRGVSVKYLNRNMISQIQAVGVDFFKLKEWSLSKGSYFTESDVKSAKKVVIIGAAVRNTLFANISPMDKVILINNNPFKVVGSFEEMGQALSGADVDNILIMPFTTAGYKIFGRKGFKEIFVSVKHDSMIEEGKNIIRRYFRMKHKLLHNDKDDFEIKTSAEKLRMAEYISQALSILLAGVASISLFVGGVGIMNIMLVSVNERIREIGIRMAIGAKKKDILIQFLIESVTLSGIGGVVGIILGLLGYRIIVGFVEWPFLFSMTAVFVSFLFACGVGVFFGYYPAKKAADLKPIEALRFE